MNTTPTHRNLVFDDFDAVAREADALLGSGYTKVGNWDLARTSGHLAAWLGYPVDGFPKASLPARLMLGAIRATVGPRMLRKALETQALPPRSPTLPESIPAEGGDAQAAVLHLRRAIERFQGHPGPYRPSPLYGQLDRETATRLHLIHCAHHFGHLIPKE